MVSVFKKNDRIFMHGGVLHAPPPQPFSLSYSYPPQQQQQRQAQPQQRQAQPQQRQAQPPLLPLPIPKPNNNPRNRGLSCPPINRKINNKPKSKPTFGPKKADLKQALIVPSSNRLGPDPNNLPRDVSLVLSSSVVFTLSPPPSSLPLPTFSLRPKLSCNAKAAGVDAGATDNLRRILRLR